MKLKSLLDVLSSFEKLHVVDLAGRTLANSKVSNLYYNEVVEEEVWLVTPKEGFVLVYVKRR